jgi:hypothetical protein
MSNVSVQESKRSLFDSRILAKEIQINHKKLLTIIIRQRSMIESALGSILITRVGDERVAFLTESQYVFFLTLPRQVDEIVKCQLELVSSRPSQISSPLSTKRRRTKKDRLIKRHGLTCCWCSEALTSETATIEHLIPLSQGGSNHISNLRLACYPCNNGRNQLAVGGMH